MRNSRFLSAGMGQLSLFLSLLVLTGCGDAPKRDAGNHLREATEAAQKLCANIRLIDPEKKLSKPALTSKVMETLSQAEKKLTDALGEYYEGRKAEPEEIASDDTAMAKQTLGLVRTLRGKYYVWSVVQATQDATTARVEASKQLSLALSRNADVLKCQEELSYTQKEDQKRIDDSKKEKIEAQTQVKAGKAKIKDFEGQIGELNKKIQLNNAKATSLRKQSTMTSGPDSLAKLKQALMLERKVHDDQAAIQRIELKLHNQRRLLEDAVSAVNKADASLIAIKEIQKSHKVALDKCRKSLAKNKQDIGAACKEIVSATAAMSKAYAEAFDKAQKAMAAFASAEKVIAEAVSMSRPIKKAQACSDQADAKAFRAELQLRLLDMKKVAETFTAEVDFAWKTFKVGDAPAKPDMSGLKAFCEKTSKAGEVAVAEYSAAVDLQDKAVRAASPKRKWNFQRALAMIYVNYSAALKRVGKDADAQTNIKKARKLLPQIKSGAAAAEQTESIKELEKELKALSQKK
ncbi:MAG: hypothetical protein K8S55_03785 [Phycisphaerae bacterium]|nr:hypothetical protein [Phycisphaerae bacterium]